MNLICPSCGAIHSAEAWENDAMARQAFQAACMLPTQITKVLLPYMGLFRPEKQRLRWAKSLKIINELSALVAKGHVQVQGKVARPCPPHLWAQAMEQMVERRPQLSLPLKNHNYLRQIAWQLADQADAGRERTQHQQVLNGNAQAHRDVQPQVQAPVDDGLSQLERQYLAKHGHLPGMNGDGAITCPADMVAWARRTFASEE